MCVPADGVKGVKQFALESIVGAGGKPCPPGIVGVGIGGSADYAMFRQEAIARSVGTRNGDPHVAKLEELYELLNETGTARWVSRRRCCRHVDTDTHDAEPSRGQLPVLLRRASVPPRPTAKWSTTVSSMTDVPATEEAIRDLHAGDEVTVDGHIIGIRDRADPDLRPGHRTADGLERSLCCTPRLASASLAPQVREGCTGRPPRRAWCDSRRGLGSQYGVRAICGVGGRPDEAIEPMQRLGMVIS
jgi:hypothetical protein